MKPLVLSKTGRAVAAISYWPEGPTVWIDGHGIDAAGCLKLSEWLGQAAGEISWVKDHGGTAA